MTSDGHITPPIHLVHRRDLDTGKWDECVAASLSPLIYGRAFYLDAMAAGQWDALVLGDYYAVMPLTWRSKYGIRYLYQPAFTQQSGIFYPEPVDPGLVTAFIHEAIRHFRFAEIYFNYACPHPDLIPRTNFILPLDRPYEQLAARYKKDLVRNLKLAHRTELDYRTDYDWKTALRDFKSQYGQRLRAVKEKDYLAFETLCDFLQCQDQIVIRAVLDKNRHPLSSALFLRDKHRFYLIHSTTLPAGRSIEANHFLLDQFIREWAGSHMILDFEGSDHPGIAHFYSNFGAEDQRYYFFRHNHLPWPLRLFKK